MAKLITCVACGHRFEIEPQTAGAAVACPVCETRVRIRPPGAPAAARSVTHPAARSDGRRADGKRASGDRPQEKRPRPAAARDDRGAPASRLPLAALAAGGGLALLLVAAAVWAFFGGAGAGGGALGEQRDYVAKEANFVEVSEPVPGVEPPAAAAMTPERRLMLPRTDGTDPYAAVNNRGENPQLARGTPAEGRFRAMFGVGNDLFETPGTFWDLPPDPAPAGAFPVPDDLDIPVTVRRAGMMDGPVISYPVVPADLGGPFVAVMAPTNAPVPDLPTDATPDGKKPKPPRRAPRRPRGQPEEESSSEPSEGDHGSPSDADRPKPGAILAYDLRTGKPSGRFGAAWAIFRDPLLSPDGRFLVTPPEPPPPDPYGGQPRPPGTRPPATDDGTAARSAPGAALLVWPHDGGEPRTLTIPGTVLWAGFVDDDTVAMQVQSASNRTLEFWNVADGTRERSTSLGDPAPRGDSALPGGMTLPGGPPPRAPGGPGGFPQNGGYGGDAGGGSAAPDGDSRDRSAGAVSPGGKYVAVGGSDELLLVSAADGAVVGRRPRPVPKNSVLHPRMLQFTADGTRLVVSDELLSATTGESLERLDVEEAGRPIDTPFPDTWLLSPFPSPKGKEERTRAVFHYQTSARSGTFEQATIPLGEYNPVVRRLGREGYLCLRVPTQAELFRGGARPLGDEEVEGRFGLYVNRAVDPQLAAALREQAKGWIDGAPALAEYPPADGAAVPEAAFDVPPAAPFVEPDAWTPLPRVAPAPAPTFPTHAVAGLLLDANATSYVTLANEPADAEPPPINASYHVFAQKFDSATGEPLSARFAVATGPGAAPGYLGFLRTPAGSPRGALSADGERIAIQDPYNPRRVKLYDGGGTLLTTFYPRGRTVPADRRDPDYDDRGRYLGGVDEAGEPSPVVPAVAWMKFDAAGNLLVLCDGALSSFALPAVEPRFALDLSGTGLHSGNLHLGPSRQWVTGLTRARATFLLLPDGTPAGHLELPPGRIKFGDAVTPDGRRWAALFGEYYAVGPKSTGIGTSQEGSALPPSLGVWDLQTGTLTNAVEAPVKNLSPGSVVPEGDEHVLVIDRDPLLLDLITGLHVATYLYGSVPLTTRDDGSAALTSTPQAVEKSFGDLRFLRAALKEDEGNSQPFDPANAAAPDQRDLFDPGRTGGRLIRQPLQLKVDAGEPEVSRAQAGAIAREAQSRGYTIGPGGLTLQMSYTVSDSSSTLEFGTESVRIPQVNYQWKLIDPAGTALWDGASGGYFPGRNSKYFLNPTGGGINVIPSQDLPEAQQYSVENYLFPDGDMRTAVVEEILAAERDYARVLDDLPDAVLEVNGQAITLPREIAVDTGFKAPAKP